MKCKHQFFKLGYKSEATELGGNTTAFFHHLVIMCGNCGERRMLKLDGQFLHYNQGGDFWDDVDPENTPPYLDDLKAYLPKKQ